MAEWNTHDIKQDAQTDWLVRLYEKTINGIRSYGGLPSETEEVLVVDIPTLNEQATVMRYRVNMPPGHNIPTGILD